MQVSSEAPESKFAYVVLVARRARQLMAGGRPLIDNPKNHKFTRVAEEELQRGMLEFELPEPADAASEDGKRKKS
ncbi:MAG: DNA-directed RNA polymerase subunit omega [Candidatus Acidiferrales bacterium]